MLQAVSFKLHGALKILQRMACSLQLSQLVNNYPKKFQSKFC
jgi:hypothetical protein